MDDAEFQHWAGAVQRAYDALDSSTYYQVLAVNPTDPQEVIRKAFHRRSVQLHPDRHRQTPEPVRSQVYAIYKRITEAYGVLIDPDLRRLYDAGLKEGRLRFDEEWAAARPQTARESLRNPAAQRYYQAALEAVSRGDVKGAELNLRLAVAHEGETPHLMEMIEALRARSGPPGGA
ncbi:MAG: DnaJ domain-containing protein [Myxococcales bacterium]|nr:DnaJ domain-containing protein [Myxococcales bacterium]